MKHYGDITKIDGTKVEAVDIITGGSPCQDLSVAGKRAGLSGERSGLFIEQIRIIKEMRNESRRTNNDIRAVRPRFMVWENVQGAFSSNGGEDFRIVLEETARIAESGICIPKLDGRKWPHAGCIMGNGWSIAWRLHDAQFWGVPQRRKRIALVADFGGQCAPEILFEHNGMSRDIAQGKEQKQGITAPAETDIRTTDYTAMVLENHPQDSRIKIKEDGIFQIMGARQGAEYCPHTLLVFDASRRHDYKPFGDVAETVQAQYGTGGNNTPIVLEGNGIRPSHKGRGYSQSDVSFTLNATEKHAVMNGAFVRRLTPVECERLQGYPDNWTDLGEWFDSKGKKHKASDNPRFKALGNSIALPFWQWLAERMIKQLDKDQPTMASLFDGIGGFPLVYSRCGCKPVWASEIEEFPIAVTKYHFGIE